MQQFNIKTTKKKKIVDITDILNDILEKKFWHNGVMFIFVKHTTAALTTADLDPGTDLDMLDAFEKMIPKLKYRHRHDPQHVPEHILSSLIGTSLTVPVRDSKLMLGTWQRVVLVDFSSPRERTIVSSFVELKVR